MLSALLGFEEFIAALALSRSLTFLPFVVTGREFAPSNNIAGFLS
jgi:hypothetical protein